MPCRCHVGLLRVSFIIYASVACLKSLRFCFIFFGILIKSSIIDMMLLKIAVYIFSMPCMRMLFG